jgi:hypothetical protein
VSQAVATSRNWWQMGEPQERPKQAKSVAVATGCRGNAMVRRGSTVRVRQRTLQSPRESGHANGARISITAVVAGGSGGATYVAGIDHGFREPTL